MMATIIVGIILILLVVCILSQLMKTWKKGGCGYHCPGCNPKHCAFYAEHKKKEKNKI